MGGDLGVRKAVGLAYLGAPLPNEAEVRSATAHWGTSAGTAQALLLHQPDEPEEVGPVRDDQLRMIFTCCHPALSPLAQTALTLRLLGGLEVADRCGGPVEPNDDQPTRKEPRS